MISLLLLLYIKKYHLSMFKYQSLQYVGAVYPEVLNLYISVRRFCKTTTVNRLLLFR